MSDSLQREYYSGLLYCHYSLIKGHGICSFTPDTRDETFSAISLKKIRYHQQSASGGSQWNTREEVTRIVQDQQIKVCVVTGQ